MTGQSTPPRFGTKADTLAALSGRLRKSFVLPLVRFDVARWGAERDAVVAAVQGELGAGALIVRSSARREDGLTASHAGAFRSVAGVAGGDATALAAAVDAVIASYGQPAADDQVLVQPLVSPVRLAGVLSSRDLATRAPYRVFAYDHRSGGTDAVTSGRASELATYVRFRGATQPFPGEALARCFAAFEELEGILGDDLEAELALDEEDRVLVFQARPIAGPRPAGPALVVVADWLEKVAKKVEKLSRPHPHLFGRRTVFGVMPDWNPAEIIGLKPRALALTLYKEIVTDAIWAEMRQSYGYRDLRSFPLMVSFVGVPYIDVRVSFNSFLPGSLSTALGHRLVDDYLDRLVASPHVHDKVEFDVVFSCYYPGIKERAARLADRGFTVAEVDELLAALREQTGRIMDPVAGYFQKDLARVRTLEDRRKATRASGQSSVSKIYWLLEDCKRFGTLPFSGLARSAFVGVQFLDGFVRTGIFSPEDREAFLSSLDTITNGITRDLARMAAGELERSAFLESYGHLRPGTYDILSPRYDEAFDTYYGGLDRGNAPVAREARPFALSCGQRSAMERCFAAEGLALTPDGALDFIRAAIEGRELAKLLFSHALSDALVELEVLGRRCNLEREDLSHLNIRRVMELYASLDARDLRDVLLADIDSNREAFRMTEVVKLPDLVVEPADVFHFHLGRAEPNFITLKRVLAPVAAPALDPERLDGHVVCLRAADPGYDWIFSRRIAALVTQFGGANSHMAIRAAEQGVPAVIGCGEENFRRWSRARMLDVDCANRKVTVVR